ncbi:MAG: SDR family NAD(P)-dependent oxidoreductase [Bacteroidota bacterium]
MKTILITGSTDGIGKLAAKKFAAEGHQLLLHGRNSQKLEQTIEEIKAVSVQQGIEGFLSDLSDFEDAREMVNLIIAKYSKIDILINNAGVFKVGNKSNREGLDVRFAVNYLAAHILTNGLLPLLKNSEAPRVLNLSSAAQSSVVLDALEGEQRLSEQEAYAQSKLALTMWSFDFAAAYPDITTIAVNPGSLLNTKMVQEAYGQYWSSAEKGADILHDLALSERYAGDSGQYFDNDKGDFNNAHADAYNKEKIEQLRIVTHKILQS